MNVATQIARRDFSSKTLRALAARGVTFIGVQAHPDMLSDLPMANAYRGYVVDDRGTARIWTFAQVLKAAA